MKIYTINKRIYEIRWIRLIVEKVNKLFIGNKNKDYKNMLLMNSNKEDFQRFIERICGIAANQEAEWAQKLNILKKFVNGSSTYV